MIFLPALYPSSREITRNARLIKTEIFYQLRTVHVTVFDCLFIGCYNSGL